MNTNRFLLNELYLKLERIKGQVYRKYKSLEGAYASSTWTLILDKAQASPKSKPSLFRLRVPYMAAGFPPGLYKDRVQKIALSDYMLRRFEKLCKKISRHSGCGKSGIFYSDPCGPEILERSAVFFDQNTLELRFRYGLPSEGNRTDPKAFLEALEHAFPKIIKEILTWDTYDEKEVREHLHIFEDQEALRSLLKINHWVAFIPDGAILPRESSFSQRPLKQAVPFEAPPTIKVTVKLPHKKEISGMPVKEGVTVITGGGFHGKTTLLNAVKMGIYNHIPGDGREYCVSLKDTFKINSEDGRITEGIDISPYIVNLPFHKNSGHFSSLQSSGSTSQAASVVESVRMGAECLLFDEDTSATNFIACDELMKRLIGEKDKTIIPYFETARDLHRSLGVSTMIVIGSLSPILTAADLVLKISEYRVMDLTEEVAEQLQTQRNSNLSQHPISQKPFQKTRLVDSESFRIKKRIIPFKTKICGHKEIQIATLSLDLYDNEQLTDYGQMKSLLSALLLFEQMIFKKRFSLEEAVKKLFQQIEAGGIESLCFQKGGFTEIRALDFAHALNRLRLLKIKKHTEEPYAHRADRR